MYESRRGEIPMHTDISTAGSPLSVHLLCVLPLSPPSLSLLHLLLLMPSARQMAVSAVVEMASDEEG